MKNWPILSLSRGFWITFLVALLSDLSAITNYPLWKAKWVHGQSERYEAINGIWKHIFEETWTMDPAKSLFDVCGAIIYFPGYFFTAICLTILGVHLFFRDTIDADIHSGDFVRAWRGGEGEEFGGMTPSTRIKCSLAVLMVFFIGACWIGAALVK